MLVCAWFPYCEGSKFVLISDITISDKIFSKILLKLQRFAIGRSISLVSGGNCFGVGVIVSFLYNLGHCPLLNSELTMSQKGTHKSDANCFMILAGMSPGGVDLFVLMDWRYFLIWYGLY